MELWKLLLISQIVFINSSFYLQNDPFHPIMVLLCDESMDCTGPYQSCMIIPAKQPAEEQLYASFMCHMLLKYSSYIQSSKPHVK